MDAKAQDPLPSPMLWQTFARDTNLTYQQIINKSDSVFAVQVSVDSTEDGERARFERWKMFWGTRINKKGKIFDLNKLMALKILNGNVQICAGSSPDQHNDGWRFLGPRNLTDGQTPPHPRAYYGRIDEISVNPANKNEIYASSWWGGLWKTTDGGDNWYCLTDNDPDLSGIGIKKFIVDYSVTPHRLYIVVGYHPMPVKQQDDRLIRFE